MSLAQKLLKIEKRLLELFGLRNVIIFEAEKGTRDNCRAVFEEMMKRGWQNKYKFVLFSDHPKELRQYCGKRVKALQRFHFEDPSRKKVFNRWYRRRAVLIVDENVQILKAFQDTIHVYLSHGSPLKSLREYYYCTEDTDYMLSQAEFWSKVNSYEFRINENRLVTLGLPRNDDLLSGKADPSKIFGNQYKKIIVWYPTYRQHKNKHVKRNYSGDLSIPLLHSQDEAIRINEIAKANNVLIVVKPHPVQDISFVRDLKLDHLVFISDSFFAEHGMSSYEFLGMTDALITDYSSVILDYLLTGNPIALTWEDFEEYRQEVGFAIDMDMVKDCAFMLDSAKDFEPFIKELLSGNDTRKEKRDSLMRLTNKYIDANSTKRAVDWLEQLMMK